MKKITLLKKIILAFFMIGILSFTLLTFFSNQNQKSFNEFNSTEHLEITLSKKVYNVYLVNDNAKVRVDIETRKDNKLLFRLLPENKFLLRNTLITSFNDKEYRSIGHVNINKPGEYFLILQNINNKSHTTLAIQDRNEGATYLRYILISYYATIISIALICITLLIMIIKKYLTKTAANSGLAQ